MPKLGLDLHALHRMIVINMLYLMAEHEGKLVLTPELIEQTRANKDLPAGQCKRVDEIAVAEKMEMPCELAFGMRSDATADLVEIFLQRTFLRRLSRAWR